MHPIELTTFDISMLMVIAVAFSLFISWIFGMVFLLDDHDDGIGGNGED